jgi:hypothetical protein
MIIKYVKQYIYSTAEYHIYEDGPPPRLVIVKSVKSTCGEEAKPETWSCNAHHTKLDECEHIKFCKKDLSYNRFVYCHKETKQ